jgi:hypothetical protein
MYWDIIYGILEIITGKATIVREAFKGRSSVKVNVTGLKESINFYIVNSLR